MARNRSVSVRELSEGLERVQRAVDNTTLSLEKFYIRNREIIEASKDGSQILLNEFNALRDILQNITNSNEMRQFALLWEEYKKHVSDTKRVIEDEARAEENASRARERAEKEDANRRRQRLRDAEAYYEAQQKSINNTSLSLEKFYIQNRETIDGVETGSQALLNEFNALRNSLQNITNENDMRQFILQWEEFKKKVADTRHALDEAARASERNAQYAKNLAIANASAVTRYVSTIKNKIMDTLWKSALNFLNQVYEATKKLDEELVEIRKVTNLTERELVNFTQNIQAIGDRTATTTTQLLEASAVFARSGYSTEQIESLTEEAAVLKNVSDGIESMSESAQVLISVMKAYDIPAERAREITDQLNIISNNAAISFDDLAEGVRRVGSVFASQDTSIGQLSALLTGANEILQDISKTSNGLKTISQRLRTIKNDAAKYQTIISNITEQYGKIVNVTDESGQLRGTYDILKDLAEVWDRLSKNEQQYIGEQLAGKNQITVLQALLNNWEGVETAIRNVDRASGSAAREQNAYLNSLTGAINQLKASLENMYASVQASPFITLIIKATTRVVNLTNAIGVIPIAIGLASGAAVGFINRFVLGMDNVARLMGTGTGGGGIIGAFKTLGTVFGRLNSGSLRGLQAELDGLTGTAAKLSKAERQDLKVLMKLSAQRNASTSIHLKLRKAERAASNEEIALTEKMVALEEALVAKRMLAITLIGTVLALGIKYLVDSAKKEQETIVKNYNEVSDKISDIEAKIKTLNDEINAAGGQKTNEQLKQLEALNLELERTVALAEKASKDLVKLINKKARALDFSDTGEMNAGRLRLKDESSGFDIDVDTARLYDFLDEANNLIEEKYAEAVKYLTDNSFETLEKLKDKGLNETARLILQSLEKIDEAIRKYEADKKILVTLGITEESIADYLLGAIDGALDVVSGEIDWSVILEGLNDLNVQDMVNYFGQPIENFVERMHQINKDNIGLWQQEYDAVYAVARNLQDYTSLYDQAVNGLNASQLINIIDNWEKYADVLTVENGQLKISKELVLKKAKAQIESTKATIKAEISKIERNIAAQKIELERTKAAIANAKDRIKASNKQIEAVSKLVAAENALLDVRKGKNAKISDYIQDTQLYQTRIDELTVSISNQEGAVKVLKEQLEALDKINLESLMRDAASGTSKATSATSKLNTELEKLKNLLSALQKQMTDTTNVYQKVQAAMKDIIQAEIDALETENDALDDGLEYYKARIKLVEEYYDSGIAKLEEQKKAAEEANEAEQQALKDKIEALKESTKAYEEQNKAAQDAIDEQVRALEEQIKAIDEANKAKEDELKVEEKLLEIEKARLTAQKAKDAYEQAKKSKTVRTYDAERGWIWTANQSSVQSAYNEYTSAQAAYEKLVEELEKMRADAAREEEKAALQRQIDELNEQKETLKELLEETKDNAETQEEEWEAQIDLLEQQKDEISESFDKQIEELEKQSDSLSNIEDDVERMLDRYLNDEETLAWVEAYKNASEEDRAAMEEALRAAWLDNRTARLGNDDTISELKDLLEKVNNMLETTDSILDSEGVKAWLESFKTGDYASRDSMIAEMRDTYLEFITAQQAEIDKVQASIDKLEGTINVTNDLLRYWGTGKSNTPINNYANGGVVDSGLLTQTGMLSDRVRVHGTPTTPEVILNGRQQANLLYQLARQNPSVVNNGTTSSSSSMYIANLTIEADSQDTLHNLLLQAKQLAFVGA